MELPARFIVNVRSGRAARALPAVQAFARDRGAEVVLTKRVRHAHDLAREALERGARTIVAVGGDGTLNEVGSALVGTTTVFGLVPCGSGDGLGRHLGIHGSTAHVLGVLDHGTERTIDTGIVNDCPFFTAAGLGFEAEIAARFNRLRHRGFARYLSTSATAFREWKPQRYRISHDRRTEALEAFTLVVANADQYGNNARIAPRARADDGLLDLTAVPAVTRWNAVPLLVRLFTGRLAGAANVVMRRSAQFVIERDAPGPFHTDGELHEGGCRLEFTVRPASLKILGPSTK
jgi:YegS/Rv2252/BmrU family lipid kinase